MKIHSNKSLKVKDVIEFLQKHAKPDDEIEIEVEATVTIDDKRYQAYEADNFNLVEWQYIEPSSGSPCINLYIDFDSYGEEF